MAPSSAIALIEEITEHVRHGLEERLSAYTGQGRSLEEIGPAWELARRMLEAIPVPSRWDEVLGPFYSTSQVAKLFGGISRQALDDRRKRRTILGLKTADGILVYPSFQFEGQNRVLPGLPEVLQCFRQTSEADDWMLAGWLVSPLQSLQGESVIEWLRLGKDLQPVLALARDMARRISQ